MVLIVSILVIHVTVRMRFPVGACNRMPREEFMQARMIRHVPGVVDQAGMLLDLLCDFRMAI